jgi:hypothetical protein
MAKLNRRRRWRGPALGGRLQRGVRFCFTAHNGEASTPTLTEWASFHRGIVLALLGYFIFNRGGAGTARGGYPIKMVPPPGFSLRLEWTLSRKPAVVRHLGGNRIDHLLTADLGKFWSAICAWSELITWNLATCSAESPQDADKSRSTHPPAIDRPHLSSCGTRTIGQGGGHSCCYAGLPTARKQNLRITNKRCGSANTLRLKSAAV